MRLAFFCVFPPLTSFLSAIPFGGGGYAPLRPATSPVSRLLLVSAFYLSAFSFSAVAQPKPNPLGFDMGWSPEQTEATLADLGIDGSHGTWLRIRGMAGSAVVHAYDEDRGRRTEDGGRTTEDRLDQAVALDPRIVKRREALVALRERGHRLVAMLRWSPWESGKRPSPAHLPLDLREAYERCRDLAYTYGDLIDAWEIDNEPDILFVPENAETFAAFHKACALGVLAGREHAQRSKGLKVESLKVGSSEQKLATEDSPQDTTGAGPPADSTPRPLDSRPLDHSSHDIKTLRHLDLKTEQPAAASAIMHSPMALPPGPYWEELVANDVLRYTEAFNYHYYGFPEDFRGVRDAWVAALRAAAEDGSRRSEDGSRRSEDGSRRSEDGEYSGVPQAFLPVNAKSPQTGMSVPQSQSDSQTASVQPLPAEKTADDLQTFRLSDFKTASAEPMLPLFLTEYGYGFLDRFDRHTVEGRARQQRFFELTLPAVTDGTITGAMAFVFMPYYEHGQNEFGLLAEVPEAQAESKGLKVTESTPIRPGIPTQSSESSGPAAPTGSASIGERDLPQTRLSDLKTFRLLDSTGQSPAVSPVVLDFIAGDEMQTVKRYNGHLLRRIEDAAKQKEFSASCGNFTLVLYNLSNEPITGRLELSLESGAVTLRPEDGGQKSEDGGRKTEDGGQKPEIVDRPEPYRSPDVPRSSLRPPTPLSNNGPEPVEGHWPTDDTRIISTTTGKTYAITPALELLLDAASSVPQAFPPRRASLPVNAQSPQTGMSVPQDSPVPQAFQPVNASSSGEVVPPESTAENPHSAFQPFSVSDFMLAPMARTELQFTATLPNQELRPHRLLAVWHEEAQAQTVGNADDSISAFQRFRFQHFDARLATRLYPSPAAFRLQTLDRLDFTAEDNAAARARQLARPRVPGEAQLYPHPTAERWLSTPGVDIEETATGWRITVNDLPPEPLRPAEIELPLPDGWTNLISANGASASEPDSTLRHLDSRPSDRDASRRTTALSFKYRLILPQPDGSSPAPANAGLDESAEASAKEEDPTPSHLPTDLAHAPNRFEEFELLLRDANGTFWTVWPRLLAHAESRTYLEPWTNFTPMFHSRAPERRLPNDPPRSDTDEGSVSAFKRFSVSAFPTNDLGSLVIQLRPRVLPTTIEIWRPQIVEFRPKE